MSRERTRYLAQPCHDGRWWVLKIKGGRRPSVVEQHLTEYAARALVASLEGENR